MADTLLKDIPTTATCPASDDFLELGGAGNGSRKLPTSWYFGSQLQLDGSRVMEVCDGATSLRGNAWALGSQNPAGLTTEFVWEGVFPSAAPSVNMWLFYLASAVTDPTTLANRLACVLNVNGYLTIGETGATSSDSRSFAWNSSAVLQRYGGKYTKISVTLFGNSTVPPVFKINGEDVSANFSSTSAGTAAPNWMDAGLTAAYYVVNFNAPAGRFVPHPPILGAWTLAEHQEWVQTGRYPTWCEITTGSTIPIISPSVLNGGFETAGSGGADAFANWSEGTSGTSSVNRDTADYYAGAASCRFDVDSSGGLATIGQSVLSVGVKYAAYFYGKASALGGIQISDIGTILANTGGMSASWSQYVLYVISPSSGNIYFSRLVGSGNSSSVWIDNITLYRLGPLFKPVVQVTTIADAGLNGIVGTMTGCTRIPGFKAGDRATIMGSLAHSAISTSNGTTQIGTLPAGWRVVEAQMNVDVAMDAGTTVSIGTLSTPALWINALAVATTGFKQSASASLVPVSISSNTSIYIKKSATTTVGNILVYIITIERVY